MLTGCMELRKRVRDGSDGDINITELPQKKKGRPLLIGEKLDKQVQAYLTSFPDPFVLVVVSYHGLNFKVRHLYTTCIGVWFRLDRSTTKFLPRTNKIFDIHENFAPPKKPLRYRVCFHLLAFF